MAGMAALKLAALEKDGLLEADDYDRVMDEVLRVLKGLRVPSVRCELRFQASDYNEYEQNALENFNRKNRPTPDPDMAFDMGVVPLDFAADVNLSYFPDFLREYQIPDIIDRMVVQGRSDGYLVLPTHHFPSLLNASFQIELEAKKRFKTSDVAELLSQSCYIECTWLAPPSPQLEPQDSLRLLLTIFVDAGD